ncbi:ABC transporter transmembrane domain-containing protein [Corynebacterium sp. 335C]
MSAAGERMPPVWRGRRRGLMAALVGLGVAQAALGLLMAFAVDVLLDDAGARRGAWTAALAASAVVIGLARWAERVVAEDLGQDYVREQRRRLVASAVGGRAARSSLGTILTRASNDMSAVRNWIANGIVPLLTALPLIGVVLVVLGAVDPDVGFGVAAPLALCAAAMPFLAGMAHDRARRLRRRRGRMSARIADTVRAEESVRAAGAVRRELKAVDRDSGRVVAAAVGRARVTGLIRASTTTAASLATVAVVLLAVAGRVDPAGVASTMTLLGVMATPMADLGRVVEYRQNFRAASRILAPMLAEADGFRDLEDLRERWYREAGEDGGRDGGGEVRVEGLVVAGRLVPPLWASPGERVVLRTADPGRVREVLRQLLGGLIPAGVDGAGHDPYVLVDGVDLLRAPGRRRRELVGLASGRLPIERGSVSRLASYRVPGAGEERIRGELERVGLGPVVDADPKGDRRRLKNGGRPWSVSDVTRLKIARAAFYDPPLLVLEDVAASLDDDGRAMLAELVADYPGVVLLHGAGADDVPGARDWDLDGPLVADPGERREGADDAAGEDEDDG